jgi:hypothetical protein
LSIADALVQKLGDDYRERISSEQSSGPTRGLAVDADRVRRIP